MLKPDAVEAIAQLVEVAALDKGSILQRAGSQPTALVVVRQGTVTVQQQLGAPGPQSVDVQSTEASDELSVHARVEAGAGAAFNFSELLLGSASNVTVRASSDVVLWRVPKAAYLDLARQRPDIVLELGLSLSQQMSSRLNQAEAALQDQAARERALAPYRVPAPTRGVIGNSKYAERLRRQIVTAARDPDRGPVLVFGEPGLRKDNMAALVHFGSPDRNKVIVQVDCAKMDAQLAELFGRGSKEGVLSWLGDGTVLLNNVHKVGPLGQILIKQLLQEGTYQPLPAAVKVLGSVDLPPPVRRFKGRILLTAEQRAPQLEPLLTTIQVPPLRLRPADVLDLQSYFLRRMSQRMGRRLVLSQDAERQLEGYSFPGNTQELEGIVARAAAQSEGTASPSTVKPPGVLSGAGNVTELNADVFWFATQAKDRFRWNVLNAYPLLRQFLKSDLFPDKLNDLVVKPVFAVVVLLLFLGPQDRAHNFCLNLFWDYWWPVMFLAYPFVGRIWCSFCPFMVYGEVVQRWRMAKGAPLMKWPRELADRWGGWFLFGLFAVILVWEEVWRLEETAYLSSWLLLLITGGAVVCSYLFERRLWCRYLCPIGGMNGLFAKLAMTELRAKQGVCSGSCDTYHCYKGGPAEPPEGLETLGCPVYSHPAQLTDNKNCVLCMTCLKACPHRSVEVRLRLPGIDLWTSHKPSWPEVMLMFMLLGAVYLHRLPELAEQLSLDPELWAPQGTHIAISAALLAAPGVFAGLVDIGSRLRFGTFSAALGLPQLAAAGATQAGSSSGGALAWGGAAAAAPPPFLSLSYGYLPLVWGATLAHYLLYLLSEGGRILPVAASTFGWEDSGLPELVADPAVISFLQGGTLLAASGLSLLLTRKIGQRSWATLAPQCGAIVLMTAELWSLIVR